MREAIEKDIKKLEKRRNNALARYDIIGAGQLSKQIATLKEMIASETVEVRSEQNNG